MDIKSNFRRHYSSGRWGIVLLILLLLSLYPHAVVSQQTPEIRKVIKEELLPGEVISDLPKEPEFSGILTEAFGADAAKSAQNLQYSILTAGNRNSRYFHVNKTSGVVSIKSRIDREAVCSFRTECELNFKVAARSQKGTFFRLVDFQVEVLDINDNPPEFTQPQFELFVQENSDAGRTFQIPTAFDRDRGEGNGAISYSILSGDSLFELQTKETGFNTTDLFMALTSTVNRESASSFEVLIGASDGGIPSLTGTLSVEVQVSDINDNFPVFDTPVYTKEIPEDTSTDHPILQVHASDADSGANGELSYSFSKLQPLDDLGFFRVDPDSGEIFLTQSIESRTGSDIELVVEASDKGHPPRVSRCRVRITVEDTINSMPEIYVDTLGGSKGVAYVSEYGAIGQVVAHISVWDPDSGDNGRTDCQLDSPEFKLMDLEEEGKYKAVLMSALDRESTDMYNLTVKCWDHGFPSVEQRQEFVVKITDENDKKPKFSQKTYEASIYENNTVGASIQQLTVTDEDIGKNAEIEYEVVGLNKQFFTIDSLGLMTAKVPLDREDSDRLIIQVIARDKGIPPLNDTATVVLNLLDINDMRPEFKQAIYNLEVKEGQPVGRFVGIVSASDDDVGTNKNVFYHLPLSYIQQENNFVVEMQSGVVKTKAVLDREAQSIHRFKVLATDRGNPPLTGTALVIIKIQDLNDNDPYFEFPTEGNRTVTIPHTLDPDSKIASIIAHDKDAGLNAELVYSVTSINQSSPFAVNPHTGALFLEERLSKDDVGYYTLTLMAHDQGPDQRATQAPLYVDVYFDNSTLLAAMGSGAPSKAIITTLVVASVVIVIGILVLVTFFCIRRYERKKKENRAFPNSDSTASTTKLQGGYYIAPGVRGSSSSFLAKPEDANCNNNRQDMADGGRTANPYVVMLSHNGQNDGAAEIVEISRNGPGRAHTLDDTFNTIDLDQTDDGQFSTFKSQEDILSPGLKQGSLRREPKESFKEKKASETFEGDELSCDDSTSDSGRGGSDVDVNNGAAANKDKARAQAATPISVKSGISNRLSPLPREQERTFLTFRGDSPSSFRFDSDSDTLTRQHHRSRVSPMPMVSSPAHRDAPRFNFENVGSPSNRLSESDTENDLAPRNRLPLQPMLMPGIHGPPGSGYSSGSEAGGIRQPIRVAPLPMFMPPPAYLRRDSETDQSDGSSNPSSSLRRNHVPRLPQYPGIEFSHHAYGGSNRNSIGAFSNHSAASNIDGYYPDYNPDHQYPSAYPSDPNRYSGNGYYRGGDAPQQYAPDTRMSSNYGNVVSELQESRPVSVEEDFLLPPYPEVDEEEEENLAMHSGYTGFSPQGGGERDALFSRSRFESSA